MSRELCPNCQFPQARCLCDCVQACHCNLEIAIWQHPSEAGHAKNTVPLLKACLPEIDVVIAERLTADEFNALTGGETRDLVLLFPNSEPARKPPLPVSASAQTPDRKIRLLALDGTWRKARKLVYLNPWLETLPRLSLDEPPSSRYYIRKAEQVDQLSTLEAVCAAITQLEGQSGTADRILNAFDQYLAKLAQFSPHHS